MLVIRLRIQRGFELWFGIKFGRNVIGQLFCSGIVGERLRGGNPDHHGHGRPYG